MFRLATTYAATASTAAAAFLAFRGDPPALVALLLVVATTSTVARLRMAGIGLPLARLPVRRLAALSLCLLVVSGMVLGGATPGGSAVGTASAATVFQDCDLSDSIVGAFIQGIVAPNEKGECRFNPDDQTDYANQSKTDGYAMAVTMNGSTTRYLATYDNYIQDSQAIAASKAKIEIINALNNGKTKATAKSNAKSAIRAYYAGMQNNIIAEGNARMHQLEYLFDANVVLNAASDGETINQYLNSSYTLVNGSTRTLIKIETSSLTTVTTFSGSGSDMAAKNPEDGTYHTFINSRYGSRLSEIKSLSNQTTNNINTYVDAVYSQYSQGQLNSTDLATADPGAIAYQAGTDANSTGYYGYAAIQLAALGAKGNVTDSHTVELKDTSGGPTTQTLTGTLYYTGSDVSKFVNGTEYNLSALNGVVYMAANEKDGTTQIVDLSNRGNFFEITEAVNTRTGESVNETIIEQQTYKTFNASNLGSELDDLRSLRDDYESMSAGGGGSSGGPNQTLVIVVLAAGAGALLMRGRNQRGGRR